MSNARELLSLAIDALDIVDQGAFFDADPDGKIKKAITAQRKPTAQEVKNDGFGGTIKSFQKRQT